MGRMGSMGGMGKMGSNGGGVMGIFGRLFGRRDFVESVGVASAPPDLDEEIAAVARDTTLKSLITPAGLLTQNFELVKAIASKGGEGEVADHYALYKRMRTTDLKFKSLISVRKNGVLSRESSVIPNEEDEDQERAGAVADLVRAALDNIADFRDDLRQLLDAIPVGFAVCEVVWEEKSVRWGANGTTRVVWFPRVLLHRRNGRFGFKPTGEILFSPEENKFVEVPPYKFLVLRHAPEFEHPYGVSEAEEVVWWWLFKHLDMRWWMVFSEKFGMPTAVGKHKPGATREQREALLLAIKRIQSEYGVTIPDTMSIELLEAARAGSVDTYDRFISYCDMMMAEALTGQSLATGQGSMGTGSYAQAEVHQGVRQEFIEADAIELMGAINAQLVRWIVDLNVGVEVPAPKWLIAYESTDLAGDLGIDERLVALSVPMSVDYFYDKYKRPRPEAGAAVVEKPVSGGSGGGFFKRSLDAKAQGAQRGAEKSEEQGKKTGGFGGGQECPPSFKSQGKGGGKRHSEIDVVVGKCVGVAARAWEEFRRGVEGAMIGFDDLESVRGAVGGMGVVSGVRDTLGEVLGVAKGAGYALAGMQVMRDFVLPEMQEAKKDGRDGHYGLDGRWKCLQGMVGSGVKLFEVDVDVDGWEPDSDGLGWFLGLTPWTEAELEGVAREARAAGLVVAGAETDAQVGRVQDLIGGYIQEGKTLAEFQKDFAGLWADMGLEAKAPHAVENLFRSETMRAYGAGRTIALRSDEAMEAFPMWEYMAVRDDRTRPEHEALHGVVLPADDPFWNSHTPPWDYQCRCDVVPVSRREIEQKGVEATGDVTLPDGTVLSVSQIPGASSGFRGIGF